MTAPSEAPSTVPTSAAPISLPEVWHCLRCHARVATLDGATADLRAWCEGCGRWLARADVRIAALHWERAQ